MSEALQPDPILQTVLGYAPWRSPQGHRLPGTGGCELQDWLRMDEVHGAQMALRDRLLARVRDQVCAETPGSRAAQLELLDMVLAWLGAATPARIGDVEVTRPDGIRVPLDRTQPMLTLGRLVQQDLCLLQPDGAGEHKLTAAVLCFPASWSLAEKIGRPLTGIHRPVATYDATVAKRVQRLFDALRPGIVLERANCLSYADWQLFTPRREDDRRTHPQKAAPFLRLERQTLRRLPHTGAVVFAIHTAMLDVSVLSPSDRAAAACHLGAKA